MIDGYRCRICGREVVHGRFCDNCLEKGREELEDALEDICNELDIEDEDDRDDFIAMILDRY